MSGLLEATYSVPSAGESSFMKFVKGENRFRILDKPTGEKPKHFWQLPVYSASSVKVLDITQSTVQKQLTELDRNSEWGNLRDYDVIVTKNGDGMDTTYTVTPCPKAPLNKEAEKMFKSFKETYEPEKVFDVTPTAEDEEELPF